LAENARGVPGERFAKADNYAKQLGQLQPALLAEPAVRFPLAVAQRNLGLTAQAETYYVGLRHSRPRDAWRAAAQMELWLGQPKDRPAKPVWICAQASEKPRLDGRLDESMWNADNGVELCSALRDDTNWSAMAMLAHDDEFLYIGVSCKKLDEFDYEPSDAPRPRDADLTGRDRVELLFDVDRDFISYYRLAIDHRGWTCEACWGDRSWDPAWFVAAAQSDDAWTAEAAIPLAELVPAPPTKGAAWAVGIQRVVPGEGFQSWNTPAAVEVVPEGFGYLLFR
jgi:hypothetical protein